MTEWFTELNLKASLKHICWCWCLFLSLACRHKHGEMKSELWSPSEMQRKDKKEVLVMKMTFSCGSESAHKAALIPGTKALVIIFIISFCMIYCKFLCAFRSFRSSACVLFSCLNLVPIRVTSKWAKQTTICRFCRFYSWRNDARKLCQYEIIPKRQRLSS